MKQFSTITSVYLHMIDLLVVVAVCLLEPNKATISATNPARRRTAANTDNMAQHGEHSK